MYKKSIKKVSIKVPRTEREIFCKTKAGATFGMSAHPKEEKGEKGWERRKKERKRIDAFFLPSFSLSYRSIPIL